MANSRFEYVRDYERDEVILPNVWIVVRIDGRGFHKFSEHYSFTKPNDTRALSLMNAAARSVLRRVPDLIIAYGHSDEYSFVFYKSTKLFERRREKLVSTIVSTFTASYVFGWAECMGVGSIGGWGLEEQWLPSFDGRAVCYPQWSEVRDYMSWRQVDCHINNLYNTTFWAMVLKGGMDPKDAEMELKGSLAADKNEILFSRFGINYNKEPELCRKGSVTFREYRLEDVLSAALSGGRGLAGGPNADTMDVETEVVSKSQAEKVKKARAKSKVVTMHVDIIKEEFWDERPWMLSGKPRKPLDSEDDGLLA